ncbi:flavin reductase [Salipiger mucosus]|uniref:Flavin reductase-like, FMN-binding protein n=1 Tax=Salipiger mucosus DSM 16094 TaxID=1123237 RepID=S9QIJ7_9RHOB|nr:flavin reductase [Salipiger mucosus]EPX79602.1 flavin reductase-like, FMN-binding protein [Salipiger mucosus DSM 16094]
MSTETLRDRFIAGMGRAAATVNVVTTDGAAGRAGVTVSAMSSVSADTDKPTLLVCVNETASANPPMRRNGVFCVNVLRDSQAYVADAFAGRFREELADKFDCAGWQDMPSGSPALDNALVSFDCRIVAQDQVGTHHVFFGEVQSVTLGTPGLPLVYAQRAYGSPARIESAGTLAAARAADRALTLACFHTLGSWLLPELLAGGDGDPLRLIEGDHRRVTEALASGEADAALLHDFELSPDVAAEPLLDLAPHVALPAGHPLAEKQGIAPRDLADMPMVLLDAPPAEDRFPALLREAGVEPRIALRSSSASTVRGLVARGLGYALVAARPGAADEDALALRPLETEGGTTRVMLATRRQDAESPRRARLLARLRAHLGGTA